MPFFSVLCHNLFRTFHNSDNIVLLRNDLFHRQIPHCSWLSCECSPWKHISSSKILHISWVKLQGHGMNSRWFLKTIELQQMFYLWSSGQKQHYMCESLCQFSDLLRKLVLFNIFEKCVEVQYKQYSRLTLRQHHNVVMLNIRISSFQQRQCFLCQTLGITRGTLQSSDSDHQGTPNLWISTRPFRAHTKKTRAMRGRQHLALDCHHLLLGPPKIPCALPLKLD